MAEGNAVPGPSHAHTGAHIHYSGDYTASQDADFFDGDTDMIGVEEQRKRKRDEQQNNDGENTNKRPTTLVADLDAIHSASQESRNTQVTESVIAPPLNYTLNSEGNHNIVIIKPDIDNPKLLINNPMEINKMLKSSPFKTMREEMTRVNKRKNVIVIELGDPQEINLQTITSITKIGKWPVKCYMPEKEMHNFGVIYPVDPSIETREISETIQIPRNNSNTQIIRIERFKKRTDHGWIDSPSLKLVFSGPLPHSVKINYSFYKVKPYVQEPVRCYKCQRLGHTSGGCRAAARCLVCGGAHLKDDCTSDTHKCANCGGPHKANSKECELIRQAVEIEQLKAEQGLTHADARKQVMQQNNSETERNNNSCQEPASRTGWNSRAL